MSIFQVLAAVITFMLVILCYLAIQTIPGMPYNLKKTRDRSNQGFDSLIMSEYLLSSDPSIVYNIDGGLTTGFRVSGYDATTQTHKAMERIVDDFSAMLSCVSTGWMYEVQRVRSRRDLENDYAFLSSPTHRVLNDARSFDCFEDELHVLVTFLPSEEGSSALRRFVVDSDDEGHGSQPGDRVLESLKTLELGCREIESRLRSCMLTVDRLSGDGKSDELVDVLYRNINGWGLPGVDLPGDAIPNSQGIIETPIALREYLAIQDFTGGLDISYGEEHISVITIAKYPAFRRPQLLSSLASLGIPMRDHSRIIIGHPDEIRFETERRFNDAADETKPVGLVLESKEPKSAADNAISARRISSHAIGRMDEIQEVKAELDSGSRTYSWYTRVIELRHRDLSILKAWEQAVTETLREARFNARIEHLNAADVWLSTLGSNGYQNVRRIAAHGVMIGDLTNIMDPWRGRLKVLCDKCPPNTPPILMTRRSDTLTPFGLDLHAGTGDVMSSIVVGPIRFGKTTLVNTIIGHFRKVAEDRVVGVDYLKGEERTAVMIGGSYCSPGEADTPARLSPFCGIDTFDGRRRAVEWCELVANLNLREKATGDLIERFTEAVDFLVDNPSWKKDACVSLFMQKLCASDEVLSAFSHYAKGGIYGHIFDATPHEMLSWQKAVRIYDMTSIYTLSERAAHPALLLLCADALREVDGKRRVLLVIEEAHIPLRHPFMSEWLITLLRTYRKKHLGIVFVLTDLEGIPEATLRTLRSQCGSVFATENPNVEASRDAYGFLGFDAQTISELVPSRTPSNRKDGRKRAHYPYWQIGEDGVAPFTLELSAAELEVFAKGNDLDKQRTKDAMQQFGETAPAAIFEAAGLLTEAAAWMDYYNEEHEVELITRPSSTKASKSHAAMSRTAFLTVNA